MSAYANGGWPELPPVPPPIEDLPPNATPPQIMRALGSTLLMFAQLWPRVVQALEYLRRGQVTLQEGQKRLEDAQRVSPPPMREQLASSADLAKAVGHDVAQAYEREQRNPSTPPPTGTTVAQMVEERVQVELIKIKAAALQKAEDQRQADEQEKKALAALNAKSRSRAFWTAIGALITTGSAIAYAVIDHFSR